jgi:two-component system NarL family response regulator
MDLRRPMSNGSAEESAGGEPSTIRVVIVDAHQMFREFVAAYVGDAPDLDVVATADSGQTGLGAAVRYRPDVLVMDYSLPDMHGADAIVAIKREVPGTKVVVMTARNNDAVLAGAVEAGSTAVVPLDGAPEALLSAIRGAAAGVAILPDRLRTALLFTSRSGARGSAHFLTHRELDVLSLLGDGVTTKDIAIALYISPNTVRNHIHHLITKLGGHSKLEAVSVAAREGLIDPSLPSEPS